MAEKKNRKKFEDVYQGRKGLGRGGSGTTFRVKRLKDNKTVAIKILKKDKRYDKEISISKLPKHENILAYKSAKKLVVNGKTRTVLEGPYFKSIPLMGQGSKILNDLSLDEKIYVMLCIAKAVEHLHTNERLHRDIKPENVLVNNDKKPIEVKLIDYGVSKNISEDQLEGFTDLKEFIGTERTSSPRALKGSKQCNKKDDIYSMGITFIEILFGHEWNKDLTPAERKEYSYELEFEAFMNNRLDPSPPLWLFELISNITYKREKERIKSASVIVEALENMQISKWWIKKLERSYKQSKRDLSEWTNRKVVAKCAKCGLIYTYRGKTLVKKLDQMELQWEDLELDHTIDTFCMACREREPDYYPSPFPEYEYYPGRIIDISPKT